MGKRNKNRNVGVVHNSPTYSGSVVSDTLLDIIIPVRGRFDLLERCLDSIPQAFPGIGYNIVIVDNSSSDVVDKDVVIGFYQRVTSRWNEITVIHNKDNRGFPYSCNQGARRKSSPLLFFLNSDVILDPESGTQLLLTLDNPDVGVVGMKLRFAGDGDYVDAQLNSKVRPSGKLQHIGLSINVNGDVYHPFVGWDVNHPKVNSQFRVFAVTGAALMIRRNTFNKVGGFYEGYGLGTFEDVDLCAMVREVTKLDVVVNPQATAIHFTGATAEQLQAAHPLHQNANLFRSRWIQNLTWWDFFVL